MEKKQEDYAYSSAQFPTPGAAIQEAAGGSLQSQNILGSKISLITNALVRYEGVLSEVDPVKKSMTLINVKSFGTEGRREGVNEIPVLESEIQGVQFKVDQIKDFNIISKPDITQLDPAILSTSTETVPKKPVTASPQDYPQYEGEYRGQRDNYHYRQDDRGGDFHSYRGRGGYMGQGRGGKLGGRPNRNVGELQQNPNEVLKEKLKDNFDFEQHQLKENEKREEDEKDAEEKQEANRSAAKPKYNKSSGFFDEISNSTQNKPDGERDIRGIREDVRKRDTETFGFSSTNNFQFLGATHGRGARGYRGGARGGPQYGPQYRGGYRGAGRGGYNDSYGHQEAGGYSQQSYYPQRGYRIGRGGRGSYGRGYVDESSYPNEESYGYETSGVIRGAYGNSSGYATRGSYERDYSN